jgi:hypothetical protein
MGSQPCPVVEVSRAVSIFGMVERLEELKRKAAAEIERAGQNVRDIRAVKKRVCPSSRGQGTYVWRHVWMKQNSDER